jgi:hypothetical protein
MSALYTKSWLASSSLVNLRRGTTAAGYKARGPQWRSAAAHRNGQVARSRGRSASATCHIAPRPLKDVEESPGRRRDGMATAWALTIAARVTRGQVIILGRSISSGIRATMSHDVSRTDKVAWQ